MVSVYQFYSSHSPMAIKNLELGLLLPLLLVATISFSSSSSMKQSSEASNPYLLVARKRIANDNNFLSIFVRSPNCLPFEHPLSAGKFLWSRKEKEKSNKIQCNLINVTTFPLLQRATTHSFHFGGHCCMF